MHKAAGFINRGCIKRISPYRCYSFAFFDVSPMLFRNCTRFSLVQDQTQERFKRARLYF